MNRSMLFGAIFAISTAAFSDVGIGVSFQSDDSNVYIPYDISESIRIEPSIRYYKFKAENNSDTESFELGIGLFHKKETMNNLNLLLGARVGYIDFNRSYTGSSETSGNGYFIAPTLGLEYFIGDKFSIGGEVSLRYENATQDTADFFDGKQSIDTSSIDTDTSLSARFYF